MHPLLTTLLTLTWLANALYAKLLNQAPRHTQIVAKILGPAHPRALTIAIALAEIVMAIWVVSGYQRQLCAGAQIVVVLLMNTLEATLAPELLLHGRWNFVFALLFCAVVYYWGFVSSP